MNNQSLNTQEQSCSLLHTEFCGINFRSFRQTLSDLEQDLQSLLSLKITNRLKRRIYSFWACTNLHFGANFEITKFKKKMSKHHLPGFLFQKDVLEIFYYRTFVMFLETQSYDFSFKKKHEDLLNEFCLDKQCPTILDFIPDKLREEFIGNKPTYSMNPIVDQFLVDSIILYYLEPPKTAIQRLQRLHLSTHLCSVYDSVMIQAEKLKILPRLKLNRPEVYGFDEEKWNPFIFALQMLNVSNNHIRDEASTESFAPLILEFVGTPGLGKTKSVYYLAEKLQMLFPYIGKQDLVYSRPNDKFWNGYKHQPVLLYDDPGHSRLAYDLCTELISIGSGSLQYPPMAFDKECKFASLFVFITSNRSVLRTLSKISRGAINRRVVSLRTTVVDNVGVFQNGFFRYHKGIVHTPFHLRYGGHNLFEVAARAIDYLTKESIVTECDCISLPITSFDDGSEKKPSSPGRASSVDGSIPPLTETRVDLNNVSVTVNKPLAHPNIIRQGGEKLTSVSTPLCDADEFIANFGFSPFHNRRVAQKRLDLRRSAADRQGS